MLVKRKMGGFSVLELMIVVAIIGVFVAFALPSFRDINATMRVKTVASDIHLSLMRARSEAIKRNLNVTIAAPSGWLGGWTLSAGAETVETHDAIPGDMLTITGTELITYTPSGRTTTNPVNISLVSSASSTERCVSVSLGGQPTIKQEACS